MAVGPVPAWTRFFVRAAHAGLGSAGRLSIIALHSIRREPDPLFPLELDAARFDALAAHLASSYNVLPLGEAHQRLVAGHLPPRALVITFDDGYADNAEVALPILRRHGLRATFFVATGFLDGGLMWNDAVIECVRRTPRATLDLQAFGLGTLALGSLAQRRSAIGALLPKIKYLTLQDRVTALETLRALCGQPELPTDLMMRSTQVRELAQAGMEIGAHTVRHPILAQETLSTVAGEVQASRHQLQALSGQAVDVFAYPNGRPGTDYRREHVELLREAGFRAAVSTAHGIASAADDPHQLPRFTPWDAAPWRWSARLLRAQRLVPSAV